MVRVGTSNKSDPGIPIEYNAWSGVLLVGTLLICAFLPRDPRGPGPHEFTIQLSRWHVSQTFHVHFG